jgi:hypothetical protein
MAISHKSVLTSGGSGGGGTEYPTGDIQATPVGTVALGKDSADALVPVKLDSSGQVYIANPGGGTGGTASNFGNTFPISGTAAGFTDGSTMQSAKVFDGDSGAGTELVLGTIIRKSASGGSVEAGTLANPLRTDPTGTTAQPITDGGGSITIDGTVSSTQSGTWNVETVTTITNVVHVDDNASTISIDDGAGSITVDGTVGISGVVPITDNSGSLTVDAPVGNPVFVQLSDGSAAISTLPVSLASVPSHPVTNAGTFAVQADTELTTADLDTGAGTDMRAVVGLVGTASGGGQLIPGSATDGLLVNLGANNDVTVAGSVTANAGTNLNTSALALESGGNLAAAAASLNAIDDWDESDRAKVNVIVGQAGITAGAGAVAANTPRVTHASDDPAVVALQLLDNCISGNEAQVDIVTMPDVTCVGKAAHDAAVSGNPVRIAGKSLDWAAAVTNVNADGDTVDLLANRAGIQYVADYHPNSWTVNGEYSGAQTNTSLKAAPGAGLSLYMTDILISNGATAGSVKLIDGSGGATKVGTLYFAVNGGCAISFKTPIKLTANTALCVTSVSVTTHSVTVNGFTAP